ncbi:MAG: RdgB/HAM1 family non-canonical purine NTP pyrophosphatase [Lachnospiraceae bacterium]|nr:RdgB/HAM1 family non-canonical purine NTP pyrophosphatase [Lachnospiraceae bacterium]
MRIIFATGNRDKLREIEEIMDGSGIGILSMKDAGIEGEADENGSTFEENALQKALYVYEKNGKKPDDYIMADDSGLEIDALNKEPGVLSARYMGKDTSYHEKNMNLISRLEGVPDEKRTARFVCAIAVVFPDGSYKVIRETMEGRIGYSEAGENGFGYDPIFYLPEYRKTSAQIEPEEKNKISHRGKALRRVCREVF